MAISFGDRRSLLSDHCPFHFSLFCLIGSIGACHSLFVESSIFSLPVLFYNVLFFRNRMFFEDSAPMFSSRLAFSPHIYLRLCTHVLIAFFILFRQLIGFYKFEVERAGMG